MQKQIKRHHRSSRQQRKQFSGRTFFKKLFAAFCQLSEPAQTVLIMGLLLLLAWLLMHPFLFATLIKALLGTITTWITLRDL